MAGRPTGGVQRALNYEEFAKRNVELATRTGFEPVISGLTGAKCSLLLFGCEDFMGQTVFTVLLHRSVDVVG